MFQPKLALLIRDLTGKGGAGSLPLGDRAITLRTPRRTSPDLLATDSRFCRQQGTARRSSIALNAM